MHFFALKKLKTLYIKHICINFDKFLCACMCTTFSSNVNACFMYRFITRVKRLYYPVHLFCLISAISLGCNKPQALEMDREEVAIRDALLRAAAAGNDQVVAQCLSEHASIINAGNVEGHTALHLASRYNNASVVTLLLNRGAVIDRLNNHGETALHVASDAGHAEVVTALLNRGAVTSMHQTNNDGNTAFHLAARMGENAIVTMLLDLGAPIN